MRPYWKGYLKLALRDGANQASAPSGTSFSAPTIPARNAGNGPRRKFTT